MKLFSTTKRHLLFLAVGTISVLLASLGQRLMPESAPFARGAETGNKGSCNSCHGHTEIGHPDDSPLDCGNTAAKDSHPQYEGDCADLLAYFEMVRLKRSFRSRASAPFRNSLLQGEILARQYNCFQCHGELGQGGFRNAGALKGYIPGYFGNDFALLTRGGNPESVMAWISQGIDQTLIDHPLEGPVAKYLIDKQEVSMPEFGSIPYAQRQVLTEYVIALSQFGEMDANAIRNYSGLTQVHWIRKIHDIQFQYNSLIRKKDT